MGKFQEERKSFQYRVCTRAFCYLLLSPCKISLRANTSSAKERCRFLCMLVKVLSTCKDADVSCTSPLAKYSAAIVATWKHRQTSERQNFVLIFKVSSVKDNKGPIESSRLEGEDAKNYKVYFQFSTLTF